jgi:transcriptional regulator GlxA family with amidase domain
MLDYLRKAAESADYTTSVCTGALVLANAGLLEGKKATTWWGMREQLSQLGDIEVVEDTRFVDQSPIITAAGVSAGIDMALWLVGQIESPDFARNVQRAMEYDPAPPYAAAV